MGDQPVDMEIDEVLESVAPPRKHRRKEPLMLKPLNDFHLEFEDQPVVEVPEVKRKPRKEYKTKKRLALQKKLPETTSKTNNNNKRSSSRPRPTSSPTPEPKAQQTPETPNQHHQKQPDPEVRQDQSLEDFHEVKDLIKAEPKVSPKEVVVERRTRLSNTCRVATGKSYKCTSCEFSTDRINNIVLHMKECCPKLKD